jgi:polyhydroxyalkanoate synthase
LLVSRLLPEDAALQHERAPRPLPLFLELVREVGTSEPELARAALSGLRAYAEARRQRPRPPKPAIAEIGGAALRDHDGSGPPLVLVPSLINPPDILDLDDETSLTAALARDSGRRVLLLDWGPANARAELSVAGHVEQLLLPLLAELGEPPALVGYCLGGTMAIAAANLVPVERVATIATPWDFGGYPEASRAALADIWRQARPAAKALGALPMEVLQAAFWSLDRKRTVAKFAEFGALEPGGRKASAFLELEEWANEGEPLPYPAARELIEDLFGANVSGHGEWRVGRRMVGGALDVPILNLTAANDRIAPASTVPDGPVTSIESGHVGMIVGSRRHELQQALIDFLRSS